MTATRATRAPSWRPGHGPIPQVRRHRLHHHPGYSHVHRARDAFDEDELAVKSAADALAVREDVPEGIKRRDAQVGPLVTEARLPRIGQPSEQSYEGEGYAIVRAANTATVQSALRTLVTNIQVRCG